MGIPGRSGTAQKRAGPRQIDIIDHQYVPPRRRNTGDRLSLNGRGLLFYRRSRAPAQAARARNDFANKAGYSEFSGTGSSDAPSLLAFPQPTKQPGKLAAQSITQRF
jgi:hypothetical protein